MKRTAAQKRSVEALRHGVARLDAAVGTEAQGAAIEALRSELDRLARLPVGSPEAQTRTAAQTRAIKALRRDIDRLDRVSRGPVARGRTGRRCFKVWRERLLPDGTVEVTSVVGWRREDGRSHPFDDIRRVVWVGRRGGLAGFRNVGHGIAGDTAAVKGSALLYAIDAQSVY